MNKPQSLPHDIFLVGNIASGKTTLGKILSDKFVDAIFVPEPHEKNPFLPLYMCDKQRWGFTSTLYYYLGYAQALSETSSEKSAHYCFIDAGTWTNSLLYVRYCVGEGVITADEYDFYEKMRVIIDQAYPRNEPSAFIFVKASPKVCTERMKKRGWSYQSPVTLEYIETLQGYIEKMKDLIHGMGFPVMEISSEIIDFTCPKGAQEAFGQVKEFSDQIGIPGRGS